MSENNLMNFEYHKLKVHELSKKSEIRLHGNWVSNNGFMPGDCLDVYVKDGLIMIKKSDEVIQSNSGRILY